MHPTTRPTGGYLVGFVAAAAIVGWLAERGWDRRVATVILAMLVGNLSIYLFGVTWLAAFVGFEKAPALGLIPFIPGDVVKMIIAVILLPSGWKLIGVGEARGS
jgi:biotin transporter BioY